MFLSKINIVNFKNIAEAEILLSPKINCICGNNGEGKTNLLDAVYYLSMTKSFLSSSDRYIFRYGTGETVLRGSYDNGAEGVENIAVSVKENGEKLLKRNAKTCRKISDHIGTIPVVVVSPSDVSLVHDSGEERRRFLNMMLSQVDREYLRAVMHYNKILRQRNVLLKQETAVPLLLDTLSEQLAPDGNYIASRRAAAVERIAGYAAKYYGMISGGREEIALRYVSDIRNADMKDVLERAAQRDRVMRYTTVGIQRDDVEFLMNGYPLKKCASQGQQKSFLVSLKMAQYALMKELYGKTPILLLDDVFDKLDRNRVSSLVQMVLRENFGQIFITDSNKVRVEEIVKSLTSDGRFFRVTDGTFHEIV